jgi:hypothetical protein
MIPPTGKGALSSPWVAVTGPVMLGNVDFKVLLMSLRWSSAPARGSEPKGLVTTRPSIYVADSRAMLGSPWGCVGGV